MKESGWPADCVCARIKCRIWSNIPKKKSAESLFVCQSGGCLTPKFFMRFWRLGRRNKLAFTRMSFPAHNRSCLLLLGSNIQLRRCWFLPKLIVFLNLRGMFLLHFTLADPLIKRAHDLRKQEISFYNIFISFENKQPWLCSMENSKCLLLQLSIRDPWIKHHFCTKKESNGTKDNFTQLHWNKAQMCCA